MRLYHSYVAGRRHDTGSVEMIAEHWSLAPDDGTAKIAAAHTAAVEDPKVRGPFSHVLVVVDNVFKAGYEFPSPVEAEIEATGKKLRAAREELERAEDADRASKEAAKMVKTSGDNLKAAKAKFEQLQAHLKRLAPPPKPGPTQRTQKPAPVPDEVDARLASLKDEELLKLAIELKLEVPADADREKIIALIKAAIGEPPK